MTFSSFSFSHLRSWDGLHTGEFLKFGGFFRSEQIVVFVDVSDDNSTFQVFFKLVGGGLIYDQLDQLDIGLFLISGNMGNKEIKQILVTLHSLLSSKLK